MPKVSVILTTHHGRKDVFQRAVDSVLTQSFTDFELIVIDDCSHDGTIHIAQRIKDPRFTYIKRTKNFGSDTKPKNGGILASKGEYLAFLDSDNTYRTDHLQALVNELDKHPEIALVYGQRWVHQDDKQGIGSTSEYNPMLLMQRNYIDTSDVLVRTEVVKYAGGFDETQKKYIDWNLWVRLMKAGYNFKQVPLVLTDYYVREDSKSKQVLTKKEQEYLKATGQFVNIPDWDPIDCLIQLPYLGEIKEPRVAIYSLTYDRLEYTKKCFAQMRETAGYDFDHFVIDNASTDGTQDWLMNEYECKHARTLKRNKGISRGSNIAIDDITFQGTYDIIMKVDNDCFFKNTGWLKAMVEIWKRNHRMALSCYIEGLKDNPGGAAREAYGAINGEYLGMTRHIGGICHFVDARAYKDWKWDENDFLHGAQDVEFSQYLNSKGYQSAYLENWFAEHIDGTQGQHDKFPEYFARRVTEKTTRS